MTRQQSYRKELQRQIIRGSIILAVDWFWGVGSSNAVSPIAVGDSSGDAADSCYLTDLGLKKALTIAS